MRNLLRTSIVVPVLLATGGVFSQTSLTTYYTIPPTSGCNGTWALGPYSALFVDCTGPYMYVFDPITCADMSGGFPPFQVSGDTMYVGLCSLPCTFELYADSGLCLQLICGIPTLLVEEPRSGMEAAVIVPNLVSASDPVLDVRIAEAQRTTAIVLDASGKVLMTEVLGPGNTRLHLGTLAIGQYVLVLSDEAGRFTTHRFSME